MPMLAHSVPTSVRKPLRMGVRNPILSSIACAPLKVLVAALLRYQ
jgi:hypothetical protein